MSDIRIYLGKVFTLSYAFRRPPKTSFKRNFEPSRFSVNLQAARPLKRLGTSSSALIYGRITEQTLSLRIPLPLARIPYSLIAIERKLSRGYFRNSDSCKLSKLRKFFLTIQIQSMLILHRKLVSKCINLLDQMAIWNIWN